MPDVYLAGGVVLEVDGRTYHASAEAFERDRARQNLFALHGLIVLRFTWSMIEHQPDLVIGQVLAALALAGRKPGRPHRRSTVDSPTCPQDAPK